MNCYYHSAVSAVAICKSCNRGLCPDCAADVPPGTACVGRCEEDVRGINLLLQRGETAYQKTGNAYKRNSIFGLILGLIFMVVGLTPLMLGYGYSSVFLSVIGAAYFLWSWFSYKSGREIQSVEKSADK